MIVNPILPYRRRRRFIELIKGAGLISSLKMCFDPGDRNSYYGGQNLRDVSDSRYTMTLGATGAVGSDDPVFNGALGKQSAKEYFSSAGAGGFQLASANDSFIDGLHKLGAAWTLVEIVNFTSSFGASLYTKAGNVIGGTGAGVATALTGSLPNGMLLSVSIANGYDQYYRTGSHGFAPGFYMFGTGVQINGNADRDYCFYRSGDYEPSKSTDNFTLAPGAAASPLKYGLTSNGSAFLGSGRQVHGMALFNKLLSKAELDTLRASCKRRWPAI